jgi:hypothetical protein
MHIDHEIDDHHRVVVLTLTGTLSDAGLLGLGDLIESMPSVARDFSVLVDLRFTDGVEVTTEGVRRMAARKLVLSARSRRAVVVPTVLGFGMARMYELVRGESSFRAFWDYDKARKWVETGVE